MATDTAPNPPTHPNQSRPIIVAGAGLGGLTAALALHRRGFSVRVLEQASALGEVGAGVQISANGNRVLAALGLAGGLARVGFTPESGEVRHWQTGETLIARPLGDSSVKRFGFPYYHLHRADLHKTLADALLARAPDCLSLGAKVAEFEVIEGGVRVTTSSGERFEGAALIGCDGIHSVIRSQLFGPDQPRFTGAVAWRTTLPTADLPVNHVRPVASNWIGQGGHFVHYYVRSGALVNCVGVIEQDAWHAESWSAPGDPNEFARDFRHWHRDLQVLIEKSTACFRWGLFDRDPMPAWSEGPVTLLGDACHPMLPFMAQGAVMSIEDAYILADCLSEAGQIANLEAVDIPKALKRYELLRRERTARVQQMSRQNMEFFHNPDVPNLAERLDAHRAAHEWLYGFDATTAAHF